MADDTDLEEDISDEEMRILLEDLPLPVQRFLTSPERNAVSLSLSQKHQLHSDTAGAFDRAYVYMLLGIYTPEQFVSELRKSGLPEETIRGLSTDVNELVFKKLREEERTGVTAARPSAPTQVPLMQVGRTQEVPSNLPGQDIRLQTPIVPPPTAQIPPTVPIQASPPAAPPAPVPHLAARTMASDVELLTQSYQAIASGQAPLQNPIAQPSYIPAPAPQAPSPAYSALAQPVPAPQPSFSAYPPPMMASVHRTPVDRKHERDPITKEYGSDPYREPVEA